MLSRKSKIRPPKKNLSNDVNFEKSWSILSQSIDQILNQNASNLSFEELYRNSYNLVLRKFGKQLYENVKNQISDHLLGINSRILLNKDSMVKVNEIWESHQISMRMISDVLMYLDRVYCKENHLPLTYDIGINLFRDKIIKLNDNKIGNHLNYLVMEQITLNRNGLITDFFIIKSILKMFEALIEDELNLENGENFYLKYFEPFYIEKTHQYYENISLELFNHGNGSEYLNKVNDLILNEENKCILYLSSISLPKLNDLINKILITSKIENVLKLSNDGLKSWIQHSKQDELSLLYKLLKKVEYFDALIAQINEIIIDDESLTLREQLKQDEGKKSKIVTIAIDYIGQVIKLKAKYDTILNYFQNDPILQRNIENSFIEILNSKGTKISEYLSYFIDEFIKKSKERNDDEIEEFLNSSIIIFRFIKDKDLFEKFYKNHLAKRLLKNSNDLEKLLISTIKNEIGSSFTLKLEGMFKDMNISKDLSAKFNHKNFQINILTKTFWPIQPNPSEIILTPVLESLQKQFNQYYSDLYSGRNLSWLYNFGTIDIRIKFNKKIHELNCPTYCGIIILLFEDIEELTFKQIKELTKIPNSDLIRSLLSISVAPRTRILTKSPMSKEIKDDDIFKFNHNFSAPMTKVKILTVINKIETDQERTTNLKEIEEDRKFEIDATIVRIMKSKKILSHNELLVEIVKQLKRFKPSPQFIKRRIDNLLEREYLKRDDNDRTTYHYLA
ncbi:hypothetical protein WICMUC_005059 [Wickerhamomyces mucosus]|uniref:Cullin family profile domain-containing protein n=1 Tax=Wickerhamomyces mucosus TaxID=1378264 RepID=A0A9P8T8D5_9ASCO|nr:hypothetical protein WICMUC_005059 [Wickerhamomyces mucosus]